MARAAAPVLAGGLVVDDETFENIKDAVEDYLLTTLNVTSFRVLVDIPGQDGGAIEALDTVWSSRGGRTADIPLLDSAGACNGSIPYTYLYGSKLWIAAGVEPLQDADAGGDGWNAQSDLDGLTKADEVGPGTSILLPLEYGGNRRFGVLELQFNGRLPMTRNGKETAQDLADALSRLIWLNSSHRSRIDDTRNALERLRRAQRGAASPMEKRIVFVSSGARADPAVISAIKAALTKREDEIGTTTVLWTEQDASGNINDQIRDALSRCEFGICYLSEPSQDEPNRFVDNPNVLFEAGMLQMLHELRDLDTADYVSRWIPVREAHGISGPAPFNFSTERIVEVERDEADQVRSEALESRIGNAIDSIVAELREHSM